MQVADGLVGLVGLPELVGPSVGQMEMGTEPIGGQSALAGSDDTRAGDVAGGWVETSPPALTLSAAAGLSRFHVAQQVTVRLISCRRAAGRILLGLSLHHERLNPALDRPEQLGDAAVMSASRPLWGRVLLVERARATVSLELPQVRVRVRRRVRLRAEG